MYLKKYRRYFLILLDLLYVFLAYGLAYFFTNSERHFYALSGGEYTVFFTGLIYIAFFLLFDLYTVLWLHASIHEYVKGVTGGILACCLVCMLNILAPDNAASYLPKIDMKVNILAGLFIIALVLGTRVIMRQEKSIVTNLHMRRKNTRTNLLIVGAGNAAGLILHEIFQKPKPKYNVVGLIDDNIAKLNCKMNGIKVVGNRNDIPAACKKYHAEEILIAVPSLEPGDKRQIINICNNTGLPVKILPAIAKMIAPQNMLHSIRNVEIEDLLERDTIQLNNSEIAGLVKDETVLVTGGGGSIGSELCRQIARYAPSELVVLDIYENSVYDLQQELKRTMPNLKVHAVIASIRDRQRIRQIFEQFRPKVVFHAAAHKHVPLMEDSPQEAIKNNVAGTLNLALTADECEVERFVMISTDKAVNPTNIMGATKRMCEMIIQAVNEKSKTNFVAVRFGNVLGSNGSAVPLFKKQIAEGGPVTVTHKEITRYFMTIPEAVQLVLQAASYANGGEIFVLDMGEPVKIYDLAEKLIRLSGLEPNEDIKIKITGLRPGEKLYEELLMAEEGLTGTAHQKIFVAKPSQFDMEKIVQSVEWLIDIAEKRNNEEVKLALAKIVPTYRAEVSEKDMAVS